MNYCEKIRYNIYTTEKADFEEMVDKLLAHYRRTNKYSGWPFSACRMIMNNMFRAALCCVKKYVNTMGTMNRC